MWSGSARSLVDLNRLIRPRLFVMDAIVAMEGNGPRGGDPRHVGLLLVSDDPVAVDTLGCRIMALDPALVHTVVYGEKWGLGSASEIEILGDDLPVFPDYKVNRTPMSTTSGVGSSLGKRLLAPRPFIREELCSRCARACRCARPILKRSTGVPVITARHRCTTTTAASGATAVKRCVRSGR